MIQYIFIKNYKKYQHYLDRQVTTWIKLYFSLLDDYKFCSLNYEEKWAFIGLILLAGKMKNCIPKDCDFLQQRIGMNKNISIIVERLLKDQFIVQADSIDEVYKLSITEREKERKERKDIYWTYAEEVIDYLNKKAGKHFEKTESNLKFITARLSEGSSKAECLMIIDYKFYDWKTKPEKNGEESVMEQYLRPETLFNKTKFSQYLGVIKGFEEKKKEKELVENRRKELQKTQLKELEEERITPEELKKLKEERKGKKL